MTVTENWDDRKEQVGEEKSTVGLVLWYLMWLSTTFRLYHGGQFYWWRKPVDWKNHWPAASHWQTIHNVVYTSPWAGVEPTISVVIGTDCIGSCKSNYHMITVTTAPAHLVPIWMITDKWIKRPPNITNTLTTTFQNPLGNHNILHVFLIKIWSWP